MLQLDENELDRRFDELVEQGQLIYGPSTITSIVDDGIPVATSISRWPWGKRANHFNSLSFGCVQRSEKSHNPKNKRPMSP
jgi:hypothetical protein